MVHVLGVAGGRGEVSITSSTTIVVTTWDDAGAPADFDAISVMLWRLSG